MNEVRKPTYIFYCGDRDSTGCDIDRFVCAQMGELANVEIHFRRLAVLPEQIEEWNLPTRPTKTTDSRAGNFEGDSVETEAIEPQKLRGIVRSAIMEHIPEGWLERTRIAEESEKQLLGMFAQEAKDEFGEY